MKKKASLNISVEAIIILILAITMLGLGLGFIKNMFGKVSKTLEQQIAEEPEPELATGEEPIKVSRGNIVANAGKQEIIKVDVYNLRREEVNDAPFIGCTGLNPAGSDKLSDQQVNVKIIQPGAREKYNLIFTVPANAVKKTYLCKVGFPAVPPISYRDVTLQISV